MVNIEGLISWGKVLGLNLCMGYPLVLDSCVVGGHGGRYYDSQLVLGYCGQEARFRRGGSSDVLSEDICLLHGLHVGGENLEVTIMGWDMSVLVELYSSKPGGMSQMPMGALGTLSDLVTEEVAVQMERHGSCNYVTLFSGGLIVRGV